MRPVEEWEVEMYESEQLCCDMANTILQMFADKKVRIHESQLILTKVKEMLDRSVQYARWNVPLACKLISDKYECQDREELYRCSLWNSDAVKEEVNRRKDHGVAEMP